MGDTVALHLRCASYDVVIFLPLTVAACNNRGSDVVCSTAQHWCNIQIINRFSGKWDVFYVPTANPDPYPPTLEPYLHSSAMTSKIGSPSTWTKANREVYFQFAATGDWMRSSRPKLEKIINSGVRTVVYDDDADYICNYIGVEAMVRGSLVSSSHSSNRCANRVATHTG